MKTAILVIIFMAQSLSTKHTEPINHYCPTIDLNNDFITVKSSFEHNSSKWIKINKDSLKVGQSYYYVLAENYSAKIIIQKYRE